MIRAMDLWLTGYLRTPARRTRPGAVTDIMVAICDHFEPLHDTHRTGGLERIARWQREYPALVRPFRDADGRSPRHTFFYPVEQYDAEFLERLGDLCRETGSEIEAHLHHDRDTEAGLLEKLERGKEALARHGGLATDASGRIRFGFIHGDWALADSDPAGRHCGVRRELSVLRDSGCYADFTMPSAPHRTQTRTVNQIYYAADNGRAKPHDRGVRARVSPAANPPTGGGRQAGDLLLVQGPLALNWRRRKFGLLPRVENAELSGANPPTPDRLRLWLQLGIHVAGQPDWVFVKLHTHGGIPPNMRTLLGDAMPRFYAHLLENYGRAQGFRVHFVTAREMVNIVHAAEDGAVGDAGSYRDYRYRSGQAGACRLPNIPANEKAGAEAKSDRREGAPRRPD